MAQKKGNQALDQKLKKVDHYTMIAAKVVNIASIAFSMIYLLMDTYPLYGLVACNALLLAANVLFLPPSKAFEWIEAGSNTIWQGIKYVGTEVYETLSIKD